MQSLLLYLGCSFENDASAPTPTNGSPAGLWPGHALQHPGCNSMGESSPGYRGMCSEWFAADCRESAGGFHGVPGLAGSPGLGAKIGDHAILVPRRPTCSCCLGKTMSRSTLCSPPPREFARTHLCCRCCRQAPSPSSASHSPAPGSWQPHFQPLPPPPPPPPRSHSPHRCHIIVMHCHVIAMHRHVTAIHRTRSPAPAPAPALAPP